MASLSPGTLAPPQTGDGPIAPHHYQPPTPRELRAQAAHRLQIGVLGLASMLLLVGLANIIMDRARDSDAAAVAAGTAPPTATPLPGEPVKTASDPLAEIGVVPDLPTAKNEVPPPPPAELTVPSGPPGGNPTP